MTYLSKMSLLIALIALSGIALANDESTADCMLVAYPAFHGRIPKTFSLVPPCAETTSAPPGEYHYAFAGDATISGEVYYQDTLMMGWQATFSLDQSSLARVPEGIRSFRLDGYSDGGQDGAVSKFHLPPLQGKGKNCWHAPATVRVTRVYILSTGSDEAGEYVPVYSVLHTGAYQRCEAETDATGAE